LWTEQCVVLICLLFCVLCFDIRVGFKIDRSHVETATTYIHKNGNEVIIIITTTTTTTAAAAAAATTTTTILIILC
jgi:hypothetical protein